MVSTGPTIFNKVAGEASSAVTDSWHYKQNLEDMGLLSGSDEGRILRGVSLARAYSDIVEEQQAKERESTQTTVWLAMLDSAQAALSALERPYIEEFGDDYINGMAERFLTAEERATYRTVEERKQYMIDKYLNEDGTIKEEYRGTEVERWVPGLYEIEKAEKTVEKANLELTEDGALSASTRQEIDDLLDSGDVKALRMFRENVSDVTLVVEAEEAVVASVDSQHDTTPQDVSEYNFS